MAYYKEMRDFQFENKLFVMEINDETIKKKWCATSDSVSVLVRVPPGSVTSVHSQPCEGHSQLQVPGVPPLTLPRIPPPKPSPFKSLRRQVHGHPHVFSVQSLVFSSLFIFFYHLVFVLQLVIAVFCVCFLYGATSQLDL